MTAVAPGGPVTLDPRVRARRIAVRREEGRRRLRRLAAVGGVAGVALAAGAVSLSPLADVDTVAVRGAQHSGAEAVAAASGVSGRAMAWLDLGAARRRVEALPWVASAALWREWPGTVHVQVEERRPVATTQAADGTWRLIDAGGRVLAGATDAPDGLVLLAGPTPVGEPGSTFDDPGGLLAVAAALPDPLTGRVAGVRVGPAGPELVLTSGAVVVLGDSSQLPAKFLAVVAVLDDRGDEPFAILDARVPETPVLTGAIA